MLIAKIVSGGQTGVDRGAIAAARELGFPYGGMIPKGRLAEDGIVPEEFDQMEVAPRKDYLFRTEWNVAHSDATLIISSYNTTPGSDRETLTGGTLRTERFCFTHGKPHLVIFTQNLDRVLDWLRSLGRSDLVLNVAGPRESNSPGIQAKTHAFVKRLLAHVQESAAPLKQEEMQAVDKANSSGAQLGGVGMIHRVLMFSLAFMLLGISSICEAGPSKFNARAAARTISIALKHPDETKSILSYVAVAFAVLVGVGVVIALLEYVFLGLWKLIKLMSLGLVVHLPRKLWKERMFVPFLWRKKLFIPALWASIFKIPWLLQVKKFRRPDIWASHIPKGLFIINLIFFACDVSLCVFCLYSDVCFLFLLVPSLILTYYMYVGVYWVRIVIIVLLILACLGCGMCFGPVWAGVMAFVSIVMIVLLLLPKSNAWFRKQNSEVVDANVK